MNQWESNIKKFYIFNFFTIFFIVNPILIYYMLEKGLSMGDILLLSAIQRGFAVLIEVPTGVISDVKGHKYNLMLGTFSFAVSCVWLAYSSSFFHFLGAELFMALAGAFISGADTAFVYDSLEMNQAEADYETIYGKVRSIQYGMTAVVTLVAGYLAEIAWELPFFLAAAFAMVAFGISCTFVEPKVKESVSEISSRERYQKYYLTLKSAVSLAVKKVGIRWFLIYTAFLSLGIITVKDFYQMYLKDGLGMEIKYLGFIYTLLFICSAIVSRFTSKGVKRFGYEGLFYLLPGLACVTALGMILFRSQWVILLFFLPYISSGFLPTLVSGYLHRRTTAGQRATILSLRHMLRKMIYIIFTPLIGYASDFWGMNTALLWTGVILLFTLVLPFVYKKIYQLQYEPMEQTIHENL